MNINQFTEQYKSFKDANEIEITCDHPKHEPAGEVIKIGKQSAKRNIQKNGGEEFICRQCTMKYNNPITHVGQRRQTDEVIEVFCQHEEHEGDPSRLIKKSAYFGDMKEPYIQICRSCIQLGKTISEEHREAVRKALKGIERSEEFKQKIRDHIRSNPETTKNILGENHCTTGMLGKHHSENTKKKMTSAISGRKYSEEHRRNISEGRKKMLRETGGFTQEHRNKIREATKRQYAQGFVPHEYHLSGWHNSPKAGRVHHRSSYECKAFEKLDNDPDVKTYNVEKISIDYIDPVSNQKSSYILDIDAYYEDGSRKLIEVKPECHLKDLVVIAKMQAAVEYAKIHDTVYEMWTEVELFGAVCNHKHIREYSDRLKIKLAKDKGNEITQEQIENDRKERDRLKAKKHYDKKKKNRIEVYCEFCKENHEIAASQYQKNVNKNGRYICFKETGFLVGSREKVKKENPYASEGKKQCVGIKGCGQILPFSDFSPDASRRDGYCSSCKQCRSKNMKERYNNI